MGVLLILKEQVVELNTNEKYHQNSNTILVTQLFLYRGIRTKRYGLVRFPR